MSLVTHLTMPKLGLTMTEATLSDWHVGVGAKVEAGDVIYSVESDKSLVDVEAPRSGELTQILVAAGETVSVGTIVGELTSG